MKNFTPLFPFLIASLIVAGCAVSSSNKTVKTNYTKSKQLTTTGDSSKTITKGDITIKLTRLPNDEYAKDVYNRPITVQHYVLFSDIPERTTVNLPLSIFADLVAFRVEIENNTDHILRIKDSRIAIIPKNENPQFAVFEKDLLANTDNYKRMFKTWGVTRKILSETVRMEAYGEKYIAQNKENKKFLEDNLNTAFKNLISDIDFVYDMNKEILPGYSLNGMLLFDADPKNIENAKITFFDFATETDKAGNITEKTSFEFPLNQVDRYWEMTPNDKSWQMVSEKRYNQKVNNPDNYRLNEDTETWELIASPE